MLGMLREEEGESKDACNNEYGSCGRATSRVMDAYMNMDGYGCVDTHTAHAFTYTHIYTSTT